MKLKFEKIAEPRNTQFYLLLEYAGGDADTEHPEKHFISGINALNYKENLEIIEKEIEKFKLLGEILDVNTEKHSTSYDEIKTKYGEEMADLFDDVPGDPQCDFQFKCYLSDIQVIYIDQTGAKFRSYI